jgi:diaminopropionate ammonia-lyase
VRFAINPYREPGVFSGSDRASVQTFHRGLPAYAPTPLIRRPDLASWLGLSELYVKYEGTRFGLQAFKGLGGSWALHRLLTTRPDSFTTVSTASEGNHGRAVAWAARLMNIPAVIFLPVHAAKERIANIEREGATIRLVEGNYEDAVRRCDRESRENGWQIISDVGYDGYLEIPPLVVEGYSTLYQEIDEQLASHSWRQPDLVLIPGGVGGILHAGVDHFRARLVSPRIVGVEPEAGDCLTESLCSPGGKPAISQGGGDTTLACLNCAEVSLPSWPAIRRGVDAMLAIEDRYAQEAVRRLANPIGDGAPIEAGNSGAAATGGLIAILRDERATALKEFLRLGPKSIVLVLCTEGAIDQAEFRRVLSAPSTFT